MVGSLVRRGYRDAVAGDTRMMLALAADDAELVFPGRNSFAGTYRGKAELQSWMARFASMSPDFQIHDVVVSGAPWNMRIGVRFTDAIGDDYRNDGVEYLQVRRGRLRRLEVFVDTERISAWETRHPEMVTAQPVPRP
jgi:ketosteroid isomerase-like protein